jgi:RecB family exonuclease
MTLPPDFQFSQASLQDFVDCPRRFQLRYLLALRWPAAQAEPIEEHEQRMAQGQDFHRMIHQHMLGLPEDAISRAALDPDLERWWQNTLDFRPVASLGGESDQAIVRTEFSLVGNIAHHRLLAKYDVLIVEAGARVVILDWKTSSTRPEDDRLRERLQTRVYRFLLVQAGAFVNQGQPIEPDLVEMVYWYPEFPLSPVRLPYSLAQYDADELYLRALVEQIELVAAGDCRATDDERRCRFCPYRSYCDRGVEAGGLEDAAAWELEEPVEDLDLDFEQIGEIEF